MNSTTFGIASLHVILSGVLSDEGGSNGVEGSLVDSIAFTPRDPSTPQDSAIASSWPRGLPAQDDIWRKVLGIGLFFFLSFSNSYSQDRLAHYMQFAHPV